LTRPRIKPLDHLKRVPRGQVIGNRFIRDWRPDRLLKTLHTQPNKLRTIAEGEDQVHHCGFEIPVDYRERRQIERGVRRNAVIVDLPLSQPLNGPQGETSLN
jgi:hypothetical protein